MRVLVLGRTQALYATARALAESGRHQIAAVVTAPAQPEYSRTEADFEALAHDLRVPFLNTTRISADVLTLVREAGCEAGVSVNWVSVVQSDLLGLLAHGILNAHYGDLPRFRGNAVANWAILLGEPDVAITIHRMAAGELDAGPVITQERLPLAPATTIADVLRFGEERVPALFLQSLDGLEAGTLTPRDEAADGRAPFRCYPRLPRDGHIDWTQPAERIHALVRAVTRPFSGGFTYYRASDGALERLYVWRSRVIAAETADVGSPGQVLRNDKATGESWVMTGSGILALGEVSHGERGAAFAPGRTWRSIRLRLGMDVEDEIFRMARGSGTDAG